MGAEKFLGQVLRPIGQQGDAKEILLPRKFDRVIEKLRAVSMSLKLFMNDQVLEQNHESAFRGADGEEQVDHSNDRAIAPQNKHASTARLFENQTKSA